MGEGLRTFNYSYPCSLRSLCERKWETDTGGNIPAIAQTNDYLIHCFIIVRINTPPPLFLLEGIMAKQKADKKCKAKLPFFYPDDEWCNEEKAANINSVALNSFCRLSRWTRFPLLFETRVIFLYPRQKSILHFFHFMLQIYLLIWSQEECYIMSPPPFLIIKQMKCHQRGIFLRPTPCGYLHLLCCSISGVSYIGYTWCGRKLHQRVIHIWNGPFYVCSCIGSKKAVQKLKG